MLLFYGKGVLRMSLGLPCVLQLFIPNIYVVMLLSCGNVMFLIFGFIIHVFLKSHEQHSTLFDRTFGGPSVNKLQCYVTQSLQLERVSDPSIQRCNTASM